MHLLRRAILLQLEAAAPASLPLDTIFQGLRAAGHQSTTTAQLKTELAYLADKELLEPARALLDPSQLRYRLTANGRDYLEAEGLA